MARPLRISYAGACYHIISRGNRREDVFFQDADYELFLKKLFYYSKIYEVEIHSYCLMTNHFHLQLKTNLANISSFMRSFLTSFTILMNRRYNKSGHIFQGRYKSQLIESELYKNKLSRYIHLNPIKTASMKDKSVSECKQIIHDYKWSSFRNYIGIENNKLLNKNHILSSWGGEEKVRNYRKYIEQGLLRNNNEDLSPCEIKNIVGSDSFKDKIIKKYLLKEGSNIDSREQPELSKINTISSDDLILGIMNYYNISDIKMITQRKNGDKEIRKRSIYLLSKYCRKTETLSSIAEIFNLKISGLNMSRDRFIERLRDDNDLKRNIADLEKYIQNKEYI